jgi:hypothetical protein
MKKIIAGLFAVALVAGFARADVGAPAPTAKDLEKVVEEVNYVETAKSGIVLSGYVDVGYIYNFSNSRGFGGFRHLQDGTPGGDFNVNAVKLTLEKPLTAANEFQAGFRVDILAGEDASALAGIGPGRPFGNLNAAIPNEQDINSILIEQAYVTFRTPVGNGIDWKVGQFVTWLGYEVIERPSNLNITYGNLFQNAIPLHHLGVSAEYAFNDIVDAGVAFTNGWNNSSTDIINAGTTDDDALIANDGYGVMAKVNITNPGGNANWYNAIYYGFGSDNTTGDMGGSTFVYDTWGNWAPKFADDKLLLGVNANIGYADTDVTNNLIDEESTNSWWGAALYAKYQFTDIFSLAGRADYLHGDQENAPFNGFGASPAAVGAAGDGNVDLWSWTLTAGFDLLENFLVRAEYRLDYLEDFADGTNAAAPSPINNSQLDEFAHTVAIQAVYTF